MPAPTAPAAPVPCIHCGLLVGQRVGGVPICDDCYPLRGACCHESEDATGAERGGSAPCDVHLLPEYHEPPPPPPSPRVHPR